MTADFGSDPEVHKRMAADAALGRTAQPAETIYFLCTDGASFITGDRRRHRRWTDNLT